jgi:S-formylglutathione hydrolase
MLPGWSRTDIAGKPTDVFDPGSAPFTLLWLHDEDCGTPARSHAITTELRDRRLRCVAPLTGRSWWVDRVCPEFDSRLTPERHLLNQVLPWMQTRFERPGFAIAGFGMGGQGAVRFGFRHPTIAPVVVAVAGAFDFHERHGQGTPLDEMYPSREHARQDTAILHVHPHDWPRHIRFACPPGHPWYRGNDRLHEKLSAVGIPHVVDLDTPGAPEQLLPPLLDFVAAALDREARRLV